MNFEPVEAVANAVLFEGYMLYPYRPSSMKNRQRWNFGTLYPRSFAEAQKPAERWQFSAEVLMEANDRTKISARLRFLQLVSPTQNGKDRWDQGFARARDREPIHLKELCKGVEHTFTMDELSAEERPKAPAWFVERSRVGLLRIRAEQVESGLYRVHASVANESAHEFSATSRSNVQDASFVSAHLLLGIENGAFVSQLEPSPHCERATKQCVQDGVFPVLVGERGDRSRVLCSPIILYDYPAVAPESAGDFFDNTEMDEMLALRVLTLTDEEKLEMRGSDPYARRILERTEVMSSEQMMKVHGVIRDSQCVPDVQGFSERAQGSTGMDAFDPFTERPRMESVRVFGVDIRKGDRVRLWPQRKADIMDMAMEGKVAVIEAIEQDLEENLQFAVVLEEDPGRDLGMLRQAGHRFFFGPEEIEPLGQEAL